MPQDPESEAELRNLAAVPYQIVSPGNNTTIIGIFQDSMLGSYQFTRENVNFTPREAMNLLMMFNGVNEHELLKKGEKITSFDIMSQILPPLSLKYKTKQFKETDDAKTSNNVLEIRNGTYIRGQIDKGVLGGGTKGLLHRTCNDYGNFASAKFIDDLQNIVTEYMKTSAFSVGISDLISNESTNQAIVKIINEKKNDVKNLIDQTKIGVFENNTGKTNSEEFETQVNNILNQATSESGKVGLKSLGKDNRFVTMVNAGSKGSDLNISFMISCLGQQNVDGKRIPYGFDHRTLPHFTKYDDSPSARGFVESSYINGLSPQELFFHAMGGRVGLIDTAVKSVTWETQIVIIEKNRPIFTEIGKWIDGQLDDETNATQIQHFTARQMELLNINEGEVFIPTTDENGVVTWGAVTAITRHDPGTELYEIKTCGGRSVIVTESKSLLIWNSETKKLVETLTPEIKVGDSVPVTEKLCTPPIVLEHVAMSDYLPKNKFVHGTDFNTAIQMMNDSMNNRPKIPAGWWEENNGVSFVLPYTKKASLQRVVVRSNMENIKNGFVYPYSGNRKETYIPDKFELSEENGIFIGLFLAEGNATSSTVTITNNNENIKTFVKMWFDKHSIQWVQRERTNEKGWLSTTIIGNSSVLASFLNAFVGSGAQNKYVPTEAMISPECFVKGLLNGYFSGDGTISKNSIEACSASKRLIEGIMMLCSRLGVFCKMFKTQMKSKNVGTINILPSYRLSIRAQWGKIFSEKVSFIEETKTEKMRNIVWRNSHQNFEVYNDIVLDKIVEINIIGVEKHPKVYDLTIPSTLNFGLANGLQVRDTSTTGYIQRRLIKGLEDLMVNYDMTVRSNKNKIVQFRYGEDNIDTTKVENQTIPIVTMSIQDIYAHYALPDDSGKNKTLSNIMTKDALKRYKKEQEKADKLCQKYIDYMLEIRKEIVEHVFKYKSEEVVNGPVAFSHVISNVQGQNNITANSLVDLTIVEAFELIENCFKQLEQIHYAPPSELFKTLYYYYLSPKELLLVKRFNKVALQMLLNTVTINYQRSIVAPGEMVGMIAGQSIGEVSTQMSLVSSEKVKLVSKNKMTGEIQYISTEIGAFVDSLMEKSPEFTFNTGHNKDSFETIIEQMDHEYYTVGVTTNEQTQWNKISHVSRHPVNGDIMKIMTKSGRIVETTTSHSHLVRDKLTQGVVPIVGANMTVGMRIPIAKKIDNVFVNSNISVGDKEYKLDYLFGWFVGAYLSEGNINYYEFAITNVSPIFIELTSKFAKLFGKEIRIAEKQGEYGPSVTTKFICKELAILLLDKCGTGSFVKRIPDFAFTAPDEFKSGLIQAYFDGDGNFNHDENHNTIRVCSRSSQLIKDVSLLLSNFGIVGTIRENLTKDANMYNLYISAKSAVVYKEQIGTLLHKESLDQIVGYLNRETSKTVPDHIDRINGLGEIIARCAKTLSLPGQSRNYKYYAKKDVVGRRTLDKYYNIFSNHTKSDEIHDELAILKQAIDATVLWDEIVNIQIYTPEQTTFVYDFTVPETQTFMTDYGVIVHNTLNSVTYETHIIVRNRDKVIQKFQIGDFIEQKIKIATKTEYFEDKDTTYSEVDDYYEMPSCTEEGEICWKRIEAVTKHPVVNLDGTNTMLKVTTKEEREVVATKAKSFLKLVDGKVVPVNGDSLKVGDYIPVSLMPIDYKNATVLDLHEILPPTEYIYASEIEKAKAVMNEHCWWSKHSGKTFVLPYKRSDSFVAKVNDKLRAGCVSKTGFVDNCVYMKQTNMNNYMIPEKIELNYNFGYLLGAYAAEGCMTRFQLSISNNVEAYFAPILELCKQWNVTTKMYRHENKGQEGWTSQDLRIYNTVLCRLLDNLCGKLSHNKFVSDKIIFSNKECLLGFLDAYIGGDGCVDKKSKKITMSSVSKDLLIDVQQMLNCLGVYSHIYKSKKKDSNNRGTLPENIHQPYVLNVCGEQNKKLAQMLNIKIGYKQENLAAIISHNYKFEIHQDATKIPNEIDGVIVFEERSPDKYSTLVFDEIKSIEEVQNTTNYAYDLTIADTRNFVTYNGVACRDTFHFAGVASKSNVTRGVPRIEEILSLSSEPKNPSLTIYLKDEDATQKDKAQSIMYMLEHTRMDEIVKTIEICFDPDDSNTRIVEDQDTIDQFKVFEQMIADSNDGACDTSDKEQSKWILRMEMDPEIMLEKNITMDDVNFTLNYCFEDQVSCVYSDYNADKLVFRIRMNKVVEKSKKPKVNPLDQSDQIYMLKNFQDQLMQNVVLRGIKGIDKVICRKVKDNVVERNGVYIKQDIWVLDTVGTNLLEILGLDYIDDTKTFSNDIVEIYEVLGIEAARQTILNELVEVIAFDGTYINYHNYSVLVDRMTYTSKMISIFRHGINNDNIGPIAKASFEETPEMFLKAARHAELDTLRGISANIMCGQEGLYGTSSFQVYLDIEQMQKMEEDSKYEPPIDVNEEIDKFFGEVEKPDDDCAPAKLAVQNNVVTIKPVDMGGDNDYNPGF